MIFRYFLTLCTCIAFSFAYTCSEVQSQLGSYFEYCEEASKNAVWL